MHMKLIQFLVRLYPQQWRSRYEEELLAMLEQHPISLLDGIDLLLGMLDAHLHPHLGTTAIACSERIRQMLSTLRSSLLTIFCAYSGFVVAGISFQKLTEDKAFMDAAQTFGVVGFSFRLVVIGAVVALFAVLSGGLPIAAAIVKDALVRKRYGLLFLLATPVLALAAFISTMLILEALVPIDAPTVLMLLSRGIFITTFLGAVVISVMALCFAVAYSEISEQCLRIAMLPSFLTTLSMAVMLATTLIWGLSLRSYAPELFDSNKGLFGTNTSGSWLRIVLWMAIATGLATISLIRGLSARSALQSTAA
jgi:hypothetical protein